MSENAILKQFLEMRRSLYKEEQKPVAKGKLPKGTKEAVIADATESTLATLIEKKPGKKVVEEYFQKETNRLTSEKLK